MYIFRVLPEYTIYFSVYKKPVSGIVHCLYKLCQTVPAFCLVLYESHYIYRIWGLNAIVFSEKGVSCSVFSTSYCLYR